MLYVFQAALNTEDPQYQDKRMVAQRNGKLSVQVFNVWTQNNYVFLCMCDSEGYVYTDDPRYQDPQQLLLMFSFCRCMWGRKKKLLQICFLICV